MLRVGLTGGLGSGKSTAAALFAALGAHVLSSDAIGRELMQPGQSVYSKIVEVFGPRYVTATGSLDRRALAQAAFREGRAAALNAIVHPAVIAEQAHRTDELERISPHAVVLVESALIFETKFGESISEETNSGESPFNQLPSEQTGLAQTPGTQPPNPHSWRARFDKLILVSASDETKIARFIQRTAPQAAGQERAALVEEAERRLALQWPDERKAALCDYLLVNDGPLTELEWQVDRNWPLLLEDEAQRSTR